MPEHVPISSLDTISILCMILVIPHSNSFLPLSFLRINGAKRGGDGRGRYLDRMQLLSHEHLNHDHNLYGPSVLIY